MTSPQQMDTRRILSTFVDFFTEREHRPIDGSTLIPPPGDPVLFTTSGMHPLTPFLEGREHPLGSRLLDVQRCLRTTDLDEVGDPWHLTVFEMLGTWSLGDYDGPRSQRWGYELLVERLGLDPRRLYTTVFEGDDQVPRDDVTLETWTELGLPVELTHDDNWWSNGPTGPCGPDSEMFVWTGRGEPTGSPTTDERWVELWNHVTMRYRRLSDGSLEPLRRPNVDTGMGLERLVTILQGASSIFETDLFEPWVTLVHETWPLDDVTTRIVVDHLRSSVVVIADGVRPSNTGRGYVLRRLLRRALTGLWRVESSRSLVDLSDDVLEMTLSHFGQQVPPRDVRSVLVDEERRFRTLVERGRRLVARELVRGPLDDERLRYLHETHGLPPDLVRDLLAPA
jgi:alanyl-tRNA synthetase